MKKLQLVFALIALTTATPLTQIAQARPYVGFGIRIGPGFYYGPGPYYYGYPYYYAPPPIVYEAAPSVIIRQAPVTVIEGAPPAPRYVPPAPNVIPTQNVKPVAASPAIDSLVQKLSDANETVLRDAAMDLGRMKAQQALDPLMNVLSRDASPTARDGAARALGLIAAPRSLNALIYAAQADNDRDVRHSAQFAVEIIRTNLRGN